MKNILYLLVAGAFALYGTSCSIRDNSPWENDDTSIVPVSLVGIEAVNINNEGAHPVIAKGPVKKEAYILGVKWKTSNANPGGNQSVRPYNPYGYYPTGGSMSSKYSKFFFSVNAFGPNNPAGSNVSQYFFQVGYMPMDVDEAFALMEYPGPGQYSFRVEYYDQENKKTFEYTTPTITLN